MDAEFISFGEFMAYGINILMQQTSFMDNGWSSNWGGVFMGLIFIK